MESIYCYIRGQWKVFTVTSGGSGKHLPNRAFLIYPLTTYVWLLIYTFTFFCRQAESSRVLLLRDVTFKDAGNYTCMAQNEIGKDEVSTEVVVVGKSTAGEVYILHCCMKPPIIYHLGITAICLCFSCAKTTSSSSCMQLHKTL